MKRIAVVILTLFLLLLLAAVAVADYNVIKAQAGPWGGDIRFIVRCRTLCSLQRAAVMQIFAFVEAHPEYGLPNPAGRPEDIFFIYDEYASYDHNRVYPRSVVFTKEQIDFISSIVDIDPRVCFLTGDEHGPEGSRP